MAGIHRQGFCTIHETGPATKQALSQRKHISKWHIRQDNLLKSAAKTQRNFRVSPNSTARICTPRLLAVNRTAAGDKDNRKLPHSAYSQQNRVHWPNFPTAVTATHHRQLPTSTAPLPAGDFSPAGSDRHTLHARKDDTSPLADGRLTVFSTVSVCEHVL